jgi:hypothetical protein
MHKFFPSWYRNLTIQPSSQELEARWKLVEAIADNLTNERALGVAGLVFKEFPSRAKPLEWLEEIIREADSSFPLKDNEAEISLLSAVSAIQLLEADEGSTQAHITALAIQSCVFRKWTPVLPELLNASAAYLASESVRAREATPRPGEIKVNGMAKPVKTLKDAIDQGSPQLAMVADALMAVSTEIRNLQRQLKALRESSKHEILAEELNVLWWLMGESSPLADRPFQELGKGAPLILAKDIALLTEVLPVLPRTRAFLSKALALANADADVTGADAVQAMSAELVAELLKGLPLDLAKDFLPLSVALSRRSEVGDADTWIDPTSRLVVFDFKAKLPAAELGLQFYQENMLVRAAHE